MLKLLSLLIVTTLTLTAATFNVATTPELRTALENAAQNGEDDTIVLADGIYKTTDDGLGTFKYLDNEIYNLTLIGSNSENVILSGDETHQIFNHHSIDGAKLKVEKLTFKDGGLRGDINNRISQGGAINTAYSIDVLDCNFSNNYAISGGGIYTIRGINITNSTFIGNSGADNGGGFSCASSSTNSLIVDSTFENNSATAWDGSGSGQGGGFWIVGFVTVKNSNFINNSAKVAGGGFYSHGSTEVLGSNFTGNTAHIDNYNAGDGGGFYSYQGVVLENSIFTNNKSWNGGGFASGSYGSVSIKNSFFTGNIAANINEQVGYGTLVGGTGGGAFNSQTALTLTNTTIKENHSESIAGAFSSTSPMTIVTNSIITNNTAEKHNAIYADQLYMSNTIISNNSGGVYLGGGYSSVSNPHIIMNSVFTENNASDIAGTNNAVVNIKNNYINLENVTIQNLKSNNIFDNATLGFVDEVNGDYNLTASSDLIDAGTDNYADKFIVDGVNYLATDYADNNRSVGASMDIGIYEFSTTKPTLNSFNVTGTLKQFQELSFSVDYTLSSGRSLQSVEYDYANNGSYVTIDTHSFDDIKTYTVNVKVTDDMGEFSTMSKSVMIEALPFSDMSDEQKYKEAINPSYYTDIISLIENEKTISNTSGHELGVYEGKAYVQDNPLEFDLVTIVSMEQAIADANAAATAYVQENPTEFALVLSEVSDAAIAAATTLGVTTGKEYVQANPTEFSLVTQENYDAAVSTAMTTGKQYVQDNLTEFALVSKPTIEVTAGSIATLDNGWTLTSTPFEIADLSVFENVNIVWIYNSETLSWSAYSSDATMAQAITDATTINTITSIPAGSGVWVKK